MDPHWEALCAAGMPDGVVRPVARAVSLPAVREAVRALRGRSFPVERREPLLSWLRAFQHGYPRRFAAELGDDGAALIETLSEQPFDANRYLKLRRIAGENLSRCL